MSTEAGVADRLPRLIQPVLVAAWDAEAAAAEIPRSKVKQPSNTVARQRVSRNFNCGPLPYRGNSHPLQAPLAAMRVNRIATTDLAVRVPGEPSTMGRRSVGPTVKEQLRHSNHIAGNYCEYREVFYTVSYTHLTLPT